MKEPELRLAKQLIDQIAVETFEPTKYHDDVKERIEADIERKVEGQEIAVTAPEPEPARIIDLMEALKASLGKSKGADNARRARAQRRPPRLRPIASRPGDPKRQGGRRGQGGAEKESSQALIHRL